MPALRSGSPGPGRASARRHASLSHGLFRAHGRLCPARAFTGAGAPRTWAVAMRQTPLAAGARRPESADPGPACQGRGFGYRRHGSRKRGTRWAIRAIGCRPLLPHSARGRTAARPPAIVGRRWAGMSGFHSEAAACRFPILPFLIRI